MRGIENTSVMPIEKIGKGLGTFDTVLMMCNNFGLFGSLEKAKRLLKMLDKMTSEKGRIIAASTDAGNTAVPEHLAYQENNLKRGRMAGQLRLRVRYKKYVTPWFDYLLVSKNELENILDGTGWRVNRYLDSDGARYIAIIDKKG